MLLKRTLLLVAFYELCITLCSSEKDFIYSGFRIAAMFDFASEKTSAQVNLKKSKDDSVVSPRKINDITFEQTQVSTTSGLVTGVRTTQSNAFWEIPYAQPPINDLRYQPPQPITTPQEHIDGTRNNYLQCYQYEESCVNLPEDLCPINMKEDCLVLNVFTPSSVDLGASASPPPDRLPVLFFIHGGFFTIGSGTHHDGRELANVTNSIVVTINYRLGPFGFLMHKETGKVDIDGNQGLKDQQLAMQWVQDNIEKFGGDKTRVTIFGNSAGAQSVMFHTLSAVSKNLYKSSIQQSNPAAFSFLYPSPEMSLRTTDRLISRLECSVDERNCLMNSSAQKIINQTIHVQELTMEDENHGLYRSETYLPVIDGIEFTDMPMKLYQTGQWNHDKDMIIGVTTEELDVAVTSIPNLSEQDFFFANIQDLGDVDMAAAAVAYYKEFYPPIHGDFRWTYGKETTEYTFICPSRMMARLASQTSSGSVYFYVFDEKVLSSECLYNNNGNETGCFFASHDDDIPFVFRTVEEISSANNTEEILSVENQFSTYWGSFAETQNLSTSLSKTLGDFPSWPYYANSSDTNQPWQYMYIRSPTSEVRRGFRDEMCDFWDHIGYGGRFEENVVTTQATESTSQINVTENITETPTTTQTTTSRASNHSIKFYSTIFMFLLIAMCDYCFM